MSAEVARSVEPGPDAAQRIAGSAFLLAGLASLGLALTVGWQLAIAAFFGASAELDAFWIGAAIPKAVADSFHLGVLTLLFVVVFNMPQGEGASLDRERLASSVFNAVMLGTLALGAALVAGAPWIVAWMGPGLDPALLGSAAAVLRKLALLLVPTAFVGAMAGILHAHQRFAPFALSRVVGLALQIALLLVAAQRLGTGALVSALLLGACAMLLGCLPSFLRTGFRWAPVLDFQGSEARAVLRMLGTLVALGLLARANQISDRFFASYLGEGSVSALEFGWRFEIPVSQILAFSIALPAFALMALHAFGERLDAFREIVAGSARLTALLIAPVILFLVVMREPLAILWFQRGAFSPEAAQVVASLIPYLAVMFSCLAFAPILVFGLLSLQHTGWLIGVLSLEVLVNTALNGPLSRQLGVRGIALATAAAMVVSNAVLWTFFIRRIGGFAAAAVWHRVWRSVAVCAVAAGALAAGSALVWAAVDVRGTQAILTALLLLGLAYLGLYAALAHAAGLVRVHFLGLRPQVRFDAGERE